MEDSNQRKQTQNHGSLREFGKFRNVQEVLDGSEGPWLLVSISIQGSLAKWSPLIPRVTWLTWFRRKFLETEMINHSSQLRNSHLRSKSCGARGMGKKGVKIEEEGGALRVILWVHHTGKADPGKPCWAGNGPLPAWLSCLQHGILVASVEISPGPQGLMSEVVKSSLRHVAKPFTVPERCFKTRLRTNPKRGCLDPSSQSIWKKLPASAKRPYLHVN